MAVNWKGVYPATTTQFRADQSLDLEATASHVNTLIEAGVDGLVMLGTLGESTTLEPQEKRDVLKAALETARGRVPVLAGVAEFSTAAACRLAEDAQAMGVDGLMVLPGMVYKSDARETIKHFRTVAKASDLPIMVYDWPHQIKAFYMKRNPEDPRFARGVDVLAPEGYGEIVGGGERETFRRGGTKCER